MSVFPFEADKLALQYLKRRSMPKNDIEKQAVLLRVLNHFDERKYTEQEVNNILMDLFDDHVTVRRDLISFNYMQRDPLKGIYWVIKRDFTLEDIKKSSWLTKQAENLRMKL